MKKLLTIVLAAAMLLSLVACGGDKEEEKTPTSDVPVEPTPDEPTPEEPTPEDPTVPEHEHKYTENVVAPTCESVGYTEHVCECGDSYKNNFIDEKGHSFGEWIVVKVATVDEEGLKERICKCGEKELGLTAEEFQLAKLQGWEKQYSYQIGKKKRYLTPSEAEKIEGCVRISKTPKSTRYGRQNPMHGVKVGKQL